MFLQRHRLLVVSTVRLAAIAAALLMLTLLVVTRSRAAFSDAVVNGGNSFSTGSVVVGDDASSALFNAAGMTPSVPVANCIQITYSGTITPATIRMYATGSGTLAPYLDALVEVGSGGSFGNCSGFTPTSVAYSGTLAGMFTSHTNYATGAPTFAAATTPTTRTVRFTFTVQNDQAAQLQSATATFTWEAQS